MFNKTLPKFTPVDPQVELRSKIAQGIAWAKTIDVSAIAEKTGGSPQVVDETAGYPSSWLRFGEFLESSEKPSMEDSLDFGRSLEGNARYWFKAYVKSTFGNEPISLSTVRGLNPNQLKFYDEVFDIDIFAYRILPTIHELSDYFLLVRIMEGVRKLEYGPRAHMLSYRKDEILVSKHNSCVTMADYVAFFRTLPSYVNDCPYWIDVHRTRQKVGYYIEQTFRSSIINATTSSQLEAILIPAGIREHGRPMSENLAWQKEEKLRELHEKELKERIQREIAGK